MNGKIFKRKGIGGNTVILVERYSDFRKILSEQGDNVFSVGTETHDWVTYFRIALKRDINDCDE